MKNILFTTSLIALAYTSVYAEREKTPLYLDDTQPIELRIEDALKRMTLEEKTRLSYAQGKFSSPGCPRLGIPELWMSDGPHGVRAEINWNDWGYSGWTSDSCTAFPALTCLAATWNTSLSADYGKAIGEEALYRGKDVLLGPGVNIYRTPLNGRNFEYMGEDPYLASELCVPYIKGVQKNGVAACVKHYALNNQELWRGHIDVNISDRALREIYLPAFKAAVEKGQVWSIMGAYNKVRGVHATHNKLLNNDILKGEWKFDGCVITDWGAAHDTYEAAMYGLDIEMGSYTNGLTSESEFGYDDYYLGKNYLKMIKDGKIPMEVVDEKASRVLRLIFRTAMNRKKGFGAIANESHYQIAYDVATEGIVLLKNEVLKDKQPLLPIDPAKYEKILVVGDNATRNLMAGGGSSELKPKYISTPLDALSKQFGGKIEFAQGYMAGRPMYGNEEVIPECIADSLRNEAVTKARKSDLVIFIGGLNKNHFQDCEGGDRKSFALPFGQDKLITSLLEANKNVVVVIISGNAVEMPWVKKVPSIVQSWYLGSIGGISLRDVLIGKVNPSGKLPFSYPVKLEDNSAHYFGEESYPGVDGQVYYKDDILVGYRWFDTKKIVPLFPFGFGLSYTEFEYDNLATDKKEYSTDDTIKVTVEVENTGDVDGAETVQIYVSQKNPSVMRPVKELKGFGKVYVKSGEKGKVEVEIQVSSLAFYDDAARQWTVEDDTFTIHAAASSSDVRKSVNIKIKDRK